MNFDFTGKRALVTGGGSGLGRATALRLAQLGAKVYALSHIQEDLDSLKAEYPDIETMCVDLLEFHKSREVVQGITPIQLLVNCAGVAACTSFVDVTFEEFDELFGVNVKAIFNVTQVVAKDLLGRNEKGWIVNVSSVAGHRGCPGSSTYAATKSAINSYTKSMAAELSPRGIRVNGISPTFMSTPLSQAISEKVDGLESSIILRTPQGKIAKVDDAVNAIVYLLSDHSDMINGHNLPVDGGYLCV